MAKFSVRPRPHMADAALHFHFWGGHPCLTHGPGARMNVLQVPSTWLRSRAMAVCLALLHAALVQPWPVNCWVLFQSPFGHLPPGFTSLAVAVWVCATATVGATAKNEAITMSREGLAICMRNPPLTMKSGMLEAKLHLARMRQGHGTIDNPAIKIQSHVYPPDLSEGHRHAFRSRARGQTCDAGSRRMQSPDPSMVFTSAAS
jgi:hypothetical protein